VRFQASERLICGRTHFAVVVAVPANTTLGLPIRGAADSEASEPAQRFTGSVTDRRRPASTFCRLRPLSDETTAGCDAHHGFDDMMSRRGRGAKTVTLSQLVECPACGFYIGIPICDVTSIDIQGRRDDRIRSRSTAASASKRVPAAGSPHRTSTAPAAILRCALRASVSSSAASASTCSCGRVIRRFGGRGAEALTRVRLLPCVCGAGVREERGAVLRLRTRWFRRMRLRGTHARCPHNSDAGSFPQPDGKTCRGR
jgi:hypothetical protein